MARVFLLALLFCSSGNAFQNVEIVARVAVRPTAGLPPATLRVDASLVLIPVQVTTPLGGSVTDLSKTKFSSLRR
jgi:hypothetical protein